MQNSSNNFSTVRVADNKRSGNNSQNKKTYNIIPKILCVIAAFFLWLYVMHTESPENEGIISAVEVEIENIADLQSESGLAVYNRSGNIVDVKLTGKKSVIDKLSKEDIHAYIDVSTIASAGRHALKVYVDLPEGVDLVSPEPSSISVYVDETDTISVPVEEYYDFLYLDTTRYELGQFRFEYDSITVSGPKNKLKQIAKAKVKIDMKDRTSTFKTWGPIFLVNDKGEQIDMSYLITSVSGMNVDVPIYFIEDVELKTQFKHGYLNSSNTSVSVTPSKVTVKGEGTQPADPSSLIDTIIIDEKLITGNTYEITLKPQTSANVMIDEEDLKVKVTVQLDPALRTKQYVTNDISVKGAPSNLNYEIIDQSMTVTLRGTVEDLAKIKANDISVVVDLSGFDTESTGTISKNATIKIDSEFSDRIYEVDSYSVKIKIN